MTTTIPAGWGPTQCTVLEIARIDFKHPGTRDQVIREVLDVSSTRFFTMLTETLARPEALVYDAALVHRLERVREKQHAARTFRRLS